MSLPRTPHTPTLAWTTAALAGLLGWAYYPTLAFMAGKWAGDPQYSHGFLVPFFSAYLLYRGRETPGPWLSAPRPALAACVLAVALCMRAAAGGLLFYQLDAASLLVALAGTALATGGTQ